MAACTSHGERTSEALAKSAPHSGSRAGGLSASGTKQPALVTPAPPRVSGVFPMQALSPRSHQPAHPAVAQSGLLAALTLPRHGGVPRAKPRTSHPNRRPPDDMCVRGLPFTQSEHSPSRRSWSGRREREANSHFRQRRALSPQPRCVAPTHASATPSQPPAGSSDGGTKRPARSTHSPATAASPAQNPARATQIGCPLTTCASGGSPSPNPSSPPRGGRKAADANAKRHISFDPRRAVLTNTRPSSA